MLRDEFVADCRAEFESSPVLLSFQNAVCRNGIETVALNRRVVTSTLFSFSSQLDQTWSVTNQQSSGRCWMFAGLNALRVSAMEKLGLKDFEFSQNYLFFADKLERTNYFLHSLSRLKDVDAGDRTLAHVLEHAIDDGGQWDMLAALVSKYGLIPKPLMPETDSSSSSRMLNSNIRAILREAARDFRAASGEAEEQRVKEETLKAVYKVLCVHLGTPPARDAPLDWQWRPDKRNKDDEAFKSLPPGTTPLGFAKMFVDEPLEDMVSLVHDPRRTSPLHKSFTVDFLGNVVGAPEIRYVNVTIEELKNIALRMLLDGRPVWFGCDSSKMGSKKEGIWDRDMFDFSTVYQIPKPKMCKADRLVYGASSMTHAMLFTGVDVTPDGKTRRWKVENSWGDSHGRKGIFVINDSWLDEFLFEIAAPKKYMSKEMIDALETDPIHLPPWDPMGALARENAL